MWPGQACAAAFRLPIYHTPPMTVCRHRHEHFGLHALGVDARHAADRDACVDGLFSMVKRMTTVPASVIAA